MSILGYWVKGSRKMGYKTSFCRRAPYGRGWSAILASTIPQTRHGLKIDPIHMTPPGTARPCITGLGGLALSSTFR